MDDPAEKLSKIRKQLQDRQRDLVELEARAGIAKIAEKLRTDPPHYEHVYDAAEPFSDRKKELVEYEERSHQEQTTRRMRDLYFSVGDPELRRALIAKEREIGVLTVRYWQQELDNAATRLTTTKSALQNWWVSAALRGVLCIGLGFYAFNWVGALSGLFIGYLLSRELQHRTFRNRESAIDEADRECNEAKQTWDQVRNEPLMFSQREARTGEPDQR